MLQRAGSSENPVQNGSVEWFSKLQGEQPEKGKVAWAGNAAVTRAKGINRKAVVPKRNEAGC